MEIDLECPLKNQAEIDGVEPKVEYECLPTVCYICRRVGHNSAFCPERETDQDVNERSEKVAEGKDHPVNNSSNLPEQERRQDLRHGCMQKAELDVA